MLNKKIDNAGHAVDLNVIYYDLISDDCDVSITADECDEALSVFMIFKIPPPHTKVKRKLEAIAQLGWNIDREVFIIKLTLANVTGKCKKNLVITLIGTPRLLLAQTINGKRRSVNKFATDFGMFQKKIVLLYKEIMIKYRRLLTTLKLRNISINAE